MGPKVKCHLDPNCPHMGQRYDPPCLATKKKLHSDMINKNPKKKEFVSFSIPFYSQTSIFFTLFFDSPMRTIYLAKSKFTLQAPLNLQHLSLDRKSVV